MTKVRLVVVESEVGWWHDKVECAVRSDGTSPAADFWLNLRNGFWPDQNAALAPPESEVVHDYAKVLAMLEHLARNGYPIHGTASKHLLDGVWEIRYSRIRMAYFDVDQDGVNTPKLPNTERQISDPEEKDDWWKYPQMDLTLRLTHGFIKSAERHPDQYELAVQIREEDLENV